MLYMQVWAFFQWWYGAGWLNETRLQSQRLQLTQRYFSIPTLLQTLVQPFRQIDSEKVGGSLGVRFRAVIDSLVSRFIGAMARLVLIVVGTLWCLVQGAFILLWLVAWPLLPFALVIGIGLMIAGVGA